MVVARDGLTLGELPAGSRVGTGSPRRAAQLHALGLGLEIVGHPRQRRHPDRQGRGRASSTPSCSPAPGWPGSAGSTRSTEVLDPLQMLPAPGQGALAVECRAGDADLVAALGRARRPAHPGRGRRRAGRARHARGRLLGPGRRARRGRRGRGRRRALAPGRRPVAGRGALGPDVRHRDPRRRRRRRAARLASEMLADGAADAAPDAAPAEPARRQQRMTRGKHQHRRHRARRHATTRGWVSFVGSGPGDPACSRSAPSSCSATPTSSSPRSPSTRRWCAPLLGLPATGRRRRATRPARVRRRRLRRGRPAADPRRPRQGRRPAGQGAAAAWSG